MNKTNIVLVGFMGSGKTSIGKALAKKLKKKVRDIDDFIEDGQKRSIRDIFEKDGEAYFRQLEKEAVKIVSTEEDSVITTGGGAVLDPENMKALSKNGWIVALDAPAELIYKRVKRSRKRPLLSGADPMAEIKRLMEIRKPYYNRADFTLDTSGKSVSQVAAMILKTLKGKI